MFHIRREDRQRLQTLRAETCIVALALFVGAAGQVTEADTISWGTLLVPQQMLQSDGVSAVDGTFQFQLGIFTDPGSFTPTSANTSQWVAHWEPFDEANTTNAGFNAGTRIVNRSNTLNENGTTPVSPFDAAAYNFFDQKPYVWAFNNKQGNSSSEWALYSDSSWAFPSSSPATSPTIHDFRLAGADETVFGEINNASFDLQTHAVPEPSIGGLVLTALFATMARRRRPEHA